MSALEPDVQCEALVFTTEPAHRCKRAATHAHRFASTSVELHGRGIRVCGQHLKAIRKRERLGSATELLGEWGYGVAPHPPQVRHPALEASGVPVED